MRQVPRGDSFTTILWLTFFDQISITIGFPVLTFLCFDKRSWLFSSVASHTARSLWYGLYSAAPHIVMLFSVVIMGVLADRFGRKPILVVGALGALFLAVASLISVFAGSVTLMLVGMLIGGSFARTEATAMAAISDISQPHKRIVNIGFLQLAISLGALVGPLVGGYFAYGFWFSKLNFALPFCFAAIAASITVWITVFYFNETYIQKHKQKKLTISWRVLLTRDIGKLALVLVLIQFAWRIYYQFMPPILKIIWHFSVFKVGLFLAVVALFLCLASAFVIRWLNHYFSATQILRYAIIAIACGIVMTILGLETSNVLLAKILLWLAIGPVAMGDVVAFCAITSLFSQSIPRMHQGKIMSIDLMLVSLVWALVGLLGGGLMAINVRLPIEFSIVPILLALVVLFMTSLSASRGSFGG
ncbi:MAG: MFS transporter [Gammaproteobacteria bacterium]|nr:MFS transporter [Gammaproteobacteria bacterium]